MKIAFYTNIVSPHQLPFARELVKRVGADNYRYIYSEPFHAERSAMGWRNEQEPWILSEIDQRDESHHWLETADVLILGHRDLGLIERRCQKGLRTFYASERWFKPVPLFDFGLRLRLYIPGWVRMAVPSYFKMVRRFVALARKHDSFRLLPYGVWAESDFRLMGVPADKMTTWGYAVASSRTAADSVTCAGKKSSFCSVRRAESKGTDGGLAVVRVLWVGRMLKLKNVDVIIRAVVRANQICLEKSEGERQRFFLTLVGDGPERPRLQRLADRLQKDLHSTVIFMHPPCPIGEVREIMQQHDVYVFASNGLDGWGAVVSEALEEGMVCVGSREAGASATLLPSSCLFDPRKERSLAKRLWAASKNELPRIGIGVWSACGLAERFMSICGMKGQR